MPVRDESAHSCAPCASLSMKSPSGIAKRISQRKHCKTPAGRISFPLPRALLFFVLRGIRFVICSFAAAREPGFSSPYPRHPLLLFRTVFRPLVCFSLFRRGPVDRRGLFLFSAFCPSAFPLFTPPLTGEGKRERRGKGVNGRFLSAGHRPFLTSSVILLPYARRICRFRYNRRRSKCSVPRRTWCSGNF